MFANISSMGKSACTDLKQWALTISNTQQSWGLHSKGFANIFSLQYPRVRMQSYLNFTPSRGASCTKQICADIPSDYTLRHPLSINAYIWGTKSQVNGCMVNSVWLILHFWLPHPLLAKRLGWLLEINCCNTPELSQNLSTGQEQTVTGQKERNNWVVGKKESCFLTVPGNTALDLYQKKNHVRFVLLLLHLGIQSHRWSQAIFTLLNLKCFSQSLNLLKGA